MYTTYCTCTTQISYTHMHVHVYLNCISTLINPQRACAARVTVVVLCVCPLVGNSLQKRVCLENAVTYSTSNVGQKICGVFSATASFWRYMYGTSALYDRLHGRPF